MIWWLVSYVHDIAGPGLHSQKPWPEVKQGFEEEMWHRTVARLRNRSLLDSWPVKVQCVHTKRVTPPHPSSPLAGPAD